jgi:hypothetical protein
LSRKQRGREGRVGSKEEDGRVQIKEDNKMDHEAGMKRRWRFDREGESDKIARRGDGMGT